MPRSAGSSRSGPARRPDLRLAPLAAAAWAGGWVGTGPEAWSIAAVLTVVVAAALLAGVRRSARWAAMAVVLLVAFGTGAVRSATVIEGPLTDLAGQRASVAARVVTQGDPTLGRTSPLRSPYLTVPAVATSLTGRGSSWRLRAPVVVAVSGAGVEQWRQAPVGTTFAVEGRLEPTDSVGDVAPLLRVRGRAIVVAGPSAGLRLVDRVRRGLRAAVAHRPADIRALVPALVLGDTSALPPDLVDAFRITGLTHLTAVSGANLSLLLAFTLFAARWLGVRGWWLRGVSLLSVAVFVGLCRSEPSVLRAAAMGLVALAALGGGGGRAGPRNLSVAVLGLILVDPSLTRSYGFALSVLATAGLVWWGRRWAEVLSAWLPAVVAEAVAVPLAAQLATTPVTVELSGRISVVGLLANAAAAPFVGPATVLGFAAAGLSLLSAEGAALVGVGAAWSAQPIVWIARLGAGLPGASLSWPSTAPAIALLGLGTLLLGLIMTQLLARRWLVLLVAATMLAMLSRVQPQPGWPPPGWVMVACDVGQGDGLVVRLDGHSALVVDTGPDPPAMRRCLDQLSVDDVPLLVLTHFHADHVNGLAAVLDSRPVHQIWTSPLESPAGEAALVNRDATVRRIPLSVPPPGAAGRLGEASWQILGPLRGPGAAEEDTSAEENDASLVLLVTVRGVRLLLTGDVEPPGQQALVAGRADLHADVLKVPHHGSAQQDPAFLRAAHARFAVASMGLHNDYGHPAQRTVALIASLGMTLLRTDTEGGIAIAEDRGRLFAVTQRG